MVNKRCAVCARYFEGELNGDYTCPDCQRMGYAKPRPVSALDSIVVTPRKPKAAA